MTATDVDKELSFRFRMDTGIKVDVHNPTPQEHFDNVRADLEKRSDGFDIVLIHVPWVGDLALHFLDLRPYFEKEVSEYDQLLIHNNSSSGAKLAAIPLFREIGLLFYRDDLLSKYKLGVPETWTQLYETANLIQQREKQGEKKDIDFIGFAWQGAAYEGLTCNALEWIASRGGIDSETGQILFDSPAVLEAFDEARKWLNSISRGVDQFKERDSSRMFGDGHAAFLRIWTSAYAALRQFELNGASFQVAPLPHGEGHESVGVLGGWQLAVPLYSRNQHAAIEYARYLASSKVQASGATRGGFQPTIEAVDVKEALPFLDDRIRHIERITTRFDPIGSRLQR